MAFGTTEGADMESLGPMGTRSGGTDVEIDADFFVVGRVDVAVDNFRPEIFSVRKLLLGGRVMEKSVSPFGTEDAGSRGRDPAPAGLKGPTLSIITRSRFVWVGIRDGSMIFVAGFAIPVFQKLVEACIVLSLRIK
jgi:hypothetical protein